MFQRAGENKGQQSCKLLSTESVLCVALHAESAFFVPSQHYYVLNAGENAHILQVSDCHGILRLLERKGKTTTTPFPKIRLEKWTALRISG